MRQERSLDSVVFLDTFQITGDSFDVVLTSKGLAHLTFSSTGQASSINWLQRWVPRAQVVRNSKPFQALASQLEAYFTLNQHIFSIPLDLHGTPFQCQVWRALLEIPYGTVRTYAQVAATIGRPQATRAVGAANGANPVVILVPCHRLVSSQGRLINYGGGLAMKQRLLHLEGVTPNKQMARS